MRGAPAPPPAAPGSDCASARRERRLRAASRPTLPHLPWKRYLAPEADRGAQEALRPSLRPGAESRLALGDRAGAAAAARTRPARRRFLVTARLRRSARAGRTDRTNCRRRCLRSGSRTAAGCPTPGGRTRSGAKCPGRASARATRPSAGRRPPRPRPAKSHFALGPPLAAAPQRPVAASGAEAAADATHSAAAASDGRDHLRLELFLMSPQIDSARVPSAQEKSSAREPVSSEQRVEARVPPQRLEAGGAAQFGGVAVATRDRLLEPRKGLVDAPQLRQCHCGQREL